MQHHRRSIRLKGYDYSQAGAYFITLVTWQRLMLFGKIENDAMRLNEFGEIVRAEWERTPEIRREVELGAYVIMPNHFHAIVIFTMDDNSPVEADGRPPLQRVPHSLGSLVAGFKSAVTKNINILRGTPRYALWQRNYYEHILRDKREMKNIWNFIHVNPANWALDEENPIK